MKLIDLKKSKSSGQSTQTADAPKTLEKKKVPYEKLSKLQHDTRVQGLIKTSDNLFLDGSFVGDITIENKLVLGEHADVMGNIHAQNLIVLGKLQGEIYVQEQATFESSSFFSGRVSTKILEVKNGARFNAEITVRKEAQPNAAETVVLCEPIQTEQKLIAEVPATEKLIFRNLSIIPKTC